MRQSHAPRSANGLECVRAPQSFLCKSAGPDRAAYRESRMVHSVLRPGVAGDIRRGKTLQHVLSFALFASKHGDFRRSASTVAQMMTLGVRTDWLMPTMHILTSAAGILISTSVLVVLFRRRVGSLRFVDLVALFAPAVVINALLVTVLQIIMQLSRYQAIYVFAYAEALAGTIVLAVFVVVLLPQLPHDRSAARYRHRDSMRPPRLLCQLSNHVRLGEPGTFSGVATPKRGITRMPFISSPIASEHRARGR